MWLCEKSSRTTALFVICCAWIVAVSTHDAILVVMYQDMIEQLELNPLGRKLIQCAGGDVWLFIWLKCAGTATVAAMLVMLYRHYARIGMAVAVALASLQLLLLCYLHLR